MSHRNLKQDESPPEPSRRNFIKLFAAGTALSLSALRDLQASTYQSILELSQTYVEDESPDGVYWDALSRHYLFEDGIVMMNNGTLGPMPKPVFNTLIEVFKRQCTNPFDLYNYIPGKKEEIRRKIADFMGCDPDEIVMTRNTTEGMNFVANGLDMKGGDEVIFSTMEHPAGIHPWRLKEKRYGIVVKEVPIGLPPASVEEFVAGFEKALTPRTRIISISHTVYLSGLISPIKELCAMARAKGIPVVADSAHGIGMLDLNMHDLGVDFFATSPYKWMGAPTGVGILYVRKEAQDSLWPTIASSGWDESGSARRFETLSQRADALIMALGEAIDFQNIIGKVRIEKRIKALAGYLKRELKAIPGVGLWTSEDPYLSGGLTVFSVEGVDSARIVDYVREKYNIVVRTVNTHEQGVCVRVSSPTYVSFRHIDSFLEGVKHLASRKA